MNQNQTIIITVIAILVLGVLIFLGTQQTGPSPDTGPTPPLKTEKGVLEILVSDQPTDIQDFDYLGITLSSIRVFKTNESYEEYSPAVTSFDLTTLQGDNALSLINTTLEEGEYTKIEFIVDEVNGTVGNESVEVKLPSGKLMITSNFEVTTNQTTSFVFDISPIKKGTGDYNLQPVISESGVIGEKIRNIVRVRAEEAKGKGPKDNVPGKPDTPGKPEKGSFELLLSDEKTDITDFDSLEVIVSSARVFKKGENKPNATSGFQEFTVNSDPVELTGLTGNKVLSLINTTLETGEYTKIELYVDETVGIIGNETPEIMLPSGKLMITKNFEIKENKTTSFVFDVSVVKKGNGGYNLLPVISESGVVGKEIKNITRIRAHNKTKEQNKSHGQKGFKSCENDSDCVCVPEECCGCNNGGMDTCINKEQVEEWEEQKDCSETMCITVINCSCSCSCKNGRCKTEITDQSPGTNNTETPGNQSKGNQTQ